MKRTIVIVSIVLGAAALFLLGALYGANYHTGEQVKTETLAPAVSTGYTLTNTQITTHLNSETPVSQSIPANSKVIVLNNDGSNYFVAYYPSQEAIFGWVSSQAIDIEP